MPHYLRMGEVPPKRHTVFENPKGGIYREEVFGTEGFEGVESILYHIRAPTDVTELKGAETLTATPWKPAQHRHHHLRAAKVAADGDAMSARRLLAFHDECRVSIVTPTAGMQAFFRNATADELWFVQAGAGHFESVFGKLPFREGDYVSVPRGTTYRIPDVAGARFLLIESPGPITFPAKYVNKAGQFLENAPYCERDLHGPTELITRDEEGSFEVRVRTWDEVSTVVMPHHPFDVVGWDGCNYPFTFNIWDFEPITGRIHQ
ncbi:MAG TPA: homogentisate 1,2-dioxygenase, partial [Candidatus Thermoplasmatota archaeon]